MAPIYLSHRVRLMDDEPDFPPLSSRFYKCYRRDSNVNNFYVLCSTGRKISVSLSVRLHFFWNWLYFFPYIIHVNLKLSPGMKSTSFTGFVSQFAPVSTHPKMIFDFECYKNHDFQNHTVGSKQVLLSISE